MKESIGMVGIFQIVILFIVLFTGIMALTINNSTSFGVKDEIISNIDFNEGNILNKDKNLNEDIKEAMQTNSYRNTGTCPSGWYGFDRDGNQVSASKKASVCIRCVNVDTGLYKNNSHVAHDDFIIGYYFQVQTFYQLDIPSFSETIDFNTKGESRIFYTEPNSGNLPAICK